SATARLQTYPVQPSITSSTTSPSSTAGERGGGKQDSPFTPQSAGGAGKTSKKKERKKHSFFKAPRPVRAQWRGLLLRPLMAEAFKNWCSVWRARRLSTPVCRSLIPAGAR